MALHKILTGDEFQKLPVDHKVDYKATHRGWEYSPMPGRINTFMYKKLSPEKQRCFEWIRTSQRFERFVL